MTDFKSSTQSLTSIFSLLAYQSYTNLKRFRWEIEQNYESLASPKLFYKNNRKYQQTWNSLHWKWKRKLFLHPPSKLFLPSSVRNCCSPTLNVSKQYQNSLGLRLLKLSLPCCRTNLSRIVWKVRERRRKVSLELFLIPRSTSIQLIPEVGSLPTKSRTSKTLQFN